MGLFKSKKEKKLSISKTEIISYIAPNLDISSTKVGFTEKLHVDGLVKMDIEGNKDGISILTVGRDGKIEGNIFVQQAIIGGTIIGNINVSESIVLEPTAKIKGSIDYGEMIIDDGASVTGSVTQTPKGFYRWWYFNRSSNSYLEGNLVIQ